MTNAWTNQLAPLRRIAFDSNALIYFLENKLPYVSYVAQAVSMMDSGQAIGVMSAVAEMELLVKPMREQNTVSLARIEVFLQQQHNLVVRSVDRIVAKRAAEIRARTRLAPMDSIIVATALEERCEVIIGNDSVIASRTLGIPYLYLDDYIS